MPHEGLSDRSLAGAQEDLRELAADPTTAEAAPRAMSTASAVREARTALRVTIGLFAVASLLGAAALAGLRGLQTPWLALAWFMSGAAILPLRFVVRRAIATPPRVDLVLVVDREGWGGPPRFGGNRWFVTLESPDGARQRTRVARELWPTFPVGAIGFVDSHLGELRRFQTLVGVDAHRLVATAS
jgi:hypothetical protein